MENQQASCDPLFGSREKVNCIMQQSPQSHVALGGLLMWAIGIGNVLYGNQRV